ncbi:hypothetical protein M407DRAFT_33392 [Tulasnella calospora MUT 4182]|uniref:Major facilitator superfamily (MFS) profile domain-containing protein n=1 Tax=Tulasnella calospora MUT 4182 TaxID=1051891 RepID=A0A0C3L607_9AGAM|nr:hypothetical protein M407DRAFT_33392 [Tulasnella calospora MUT 4182]
MPYIRFIYLCYYVRGVVVPLDIQCLWSGQFLAEITHRTAFGQVFQCLYEESVLPNTSPSAIAWIGSIQYALCFMPGLLSGRLFDLGYLHIPLAIASIVQVSATILVAECTKYWHFLLVQGLVTGLANGFIYDPAMPIVSHWFRKRRSTGIGIVAAGAAVGGSVVSIVVRQLLPVVGRKWTMRILGLILLVVQGVANMLVTRRLPVTNHPGGLTNPRAFKSVPYSLYVLAAFVGFLGMYTPLTFIDVSAIRTAHLSRDFSFDLVSIINAASLIGRVGGGLCSDRFGVINILAGFSCVGALSTFVWPTVKSKGGLVALSIAYGAGSGPLVGLLAAPVAHLGDTVDVGRRTGMMFTIVSIGSLIGPPISGAIYAANGGFMEVGIYAGCTIVVYVVILMLVKKSAIGTWRGKF